MVYIRYDSLKKLLIRLQARNSTASQDNCDLQTCNQLTRQNVSWKLQTTLANYYRTVQSHQTLSILTGFSIFIIRDQMSWNQVRCTTSWAGTKN